MAVKIPFTFGSAKASCRSSRRASAEEERKRSISSACLDMVTLKPSTSNRRRAISRTSRAMIPRLFDGAMIRISSPGFNFGGIKETPPGEEIPKHSSGAGIAPCDGRRTAGLRPRWGWAVEACRRGRGLRFFQPFFDIPGDPPGGCLRGVPLDHFAAPVHQEFGEVPFDFLAEHPRSAFRQVFEQGMGVGPLHLHLAEEGKGDV